MAAVAILQGKVKNTPDPKGRGTQQLRQEQTSQDRQGNRETLGGVVPKDIPQDLHSFRGPLSRTCSTKRTKRLKSKNALITVQEKLSCSRGILQMPPSFRPLSRPLGRDIPPKTAFRCAASR